MMAKKLYFILIITIVLLEGAGCDIFMPGSKVKGQIIDILTDQPVPDVTITASTKTNIEEDKKFERRQATSDGNGQFVIKGLTNKYTYTITASKQGFSIASTRENPPEKGQTKLLEKPLQLAMLPPEFGVFIFTDGNFTKLEPISFDTIRRDSSRFGGRDHYDYISKDGLSKLQKAGRNCILISYSPSGSPSQISWDSIDPLYYFKKKKLTFAWDNPKRTDNTKNDIYVAKAVRDDLSILHTYDLSRYSREYKPPMGGAGTLKWELPCSSHKCQNGIMEITKIHYLPSGLYALRDGKKGWPFHLE